MACFFTIATNLNGYVLDVEGGNLEPGTKVVMWESNGQENQKWCQDNELGVIRSCMNPDFVLDIDDDGVLCINYYNPDSAMQRLVCADGRVHLLADPSKVLDVSDNDSYNGAKVVLWDYNGGDNQCWSINYMDQAFYVIRSAMNGMVLDIESANTDSGADVVMWEFTGADNQLWYTNHHGVVASKLNDFVLDASWGDIVMQPFQPDNLNQGFTFLDNRLINSKSPEKCVDIKDNDDSSGAHLCMWEYKGSDNQHFVQEFI